MQLATRRSYLPSSLRASRKSRAVFISRSTQRVKGEIPVGRWTASRRRFLADDMRNLTVHASTGDEEQRPEEAVDLRAFFQYDDQTVKPLAEVKMPANEDALAQGNNEEDNLEDEAEQDRLAYERLIMEGADVENAETEMEDMNATILKVQESFLNGSAYAAAPELGRKPLKKAGDFPYRSVPVFQRSLVELLQEANMHRQARQVQDMWGEDFTITGVQSRAKNVRQGDLYFAYVTDIYDGVREIPTAIKQGAMGIVIKDTSEDNDVSFDDGNGKKLLEEDRLKQLLMESKLPEEIAYAVPIIRVEDIEHTMGLMGSIYYGCPSSMMRIVGVVGSEGKTSIVWILRQIFEAFRIITGIMCDIEYAIIGDQLTEEGDLFIAKEHDPAYGRGGSTTYHHVPFKGRYFIESAVPDALQVQKVLAGMAYRGAKACIVECPIYALADGRLEHVDFDVMVHANLHSEPEDDQEIFSLRRSVHTSLFQRLNIPQSQRAIVNIDDDWAQDVIDTSKAIPVVTYSMKKLEADVGIEKIKYSQWESEMVIRTPLGNLQIITPLIGTFMGENILAAVATAMSMEINLQSIVTGIESLDFVPGRCELIDEGQDFSVVVDNADTPKRLTSLISHLRHCGVKRVFLVIGCSHYHSPEQRRAIGNTAHYQGDVVIFTTDSPGNEAPNAVIDDIIDGFPEDVLKRSEMWVLSPWQDSGRIPWWFEEWLFRAQKETKRHVVEDRGIAIRGAIGTARKGDVVIVAGRGDRDYSLWLDKDDVLVKTWFEDRVESRDALIKLPHLHKSEVVTDSLPWTESSKLYDSRSKLA